MKRKNNHGEGGHVCPSFLQRKHNRECTLRKRRKKRHRRNQSRRRVLEWKWKCLTLQLLLAVIFVFSVAGLLGYGIFYLCQNESSRNTQKELQGIRGESKKIAAPTQSSTWNTSSTSILKYFDICSINSADGVLSPRSILPTVLVLYPIAAARSFW